MKRSSTLLGPALAVALIVPLVAPVGGAVHAADAVGPLDQPLPGGERAAVTGLRPAPGVVDRNSLRREVRREQRALERLDRKALRARAEAGERGAQVLLGAAFAREAAALAFAPAAANDALSDAVRWYSLAASRGFPGAPSLDQAGVSFYPISIQRRRP